MNSRLNEQSGQVNEDWQDEEKLQEGFRPSRYSLGRIGFFLRAFVESGSSIDEFGDVFVELREARGRFIRGKLRLNGEGVVVFRSGGGDIQEEEIFLGDDINVDKNHGRLYLGENQVVMIFDFEERLKKRKWTQSRVTSVELQRNEVMERVTEVLEPIWKSLRRIFKAGKKDSAINLAPPDTIMLSFSKEAFNGVGNHFALMIPVTHVIDKRKLIGTIKKVLVDSMGVDGGFVNSLEGERLKIYMKPGNNGSDRKYLTFEFS